MLLEASVVISGAGNGVSAVAIPWLVLERTGDNALAETMYLGVRAGGHPVFPAWYRWAYGWPYGRGYMPLSDEEREQVRKKLDEYWKRHPGGYCAEHHGTLPMKGRGDDT
ncbi:MAG: hypothetical protein HGB21_15810 [Nitrospirae bacterium]|nr:hypothetical protein [Nitrospirota bacterium]